MLSSLIMIRSTLIACALLAAGCAAGPQMSASHHDARAFALEQNGQQSAALHEREAAEHAREKLEWQSAGDRDYLPPLTAF